MKKRSHIHLVGIKGVAMTALAIYLIQSGHKVTGSDVAEVFPTDEELASAKIQVFTGFSKHRIPDDIVPDVVYFTGAHGGRDNPEVIAAIKAGIPSFAHGQALGKIIGHSRQLVVSGSHGKTTTSAMVATLLSHARYDPSYAIGCGSIPGLGAAGHKGKGQWFVAEGDEYITDPTHDPTPRFLWLCPEILVVTNIDYDHPDAYENISAIQQAFVKLQAKSHTAILNADDANSKPLLGAGNVLTYGFSPAAQYRISHVGIGDKRMFFRLEERGVLLGEFAIKVPGKHNVSNAVAAVLAARTAGVNWETLREGLLLFTGTKRRFENIGQAGNITYYDDYAHHPVEIMATLRAMRAWYPDKRICVVFQPHTYHRTRALLSEFTTSFESANFVVLTDVYISAREQHTNDDIDSILFNQTARHHPAVVHAAQKSDVFAWLDSHSGTYDVCVFMGAGDIYHWGREYVSSVLRSKKRSSTL